LLGSIVTLQKVNAKWKANITFGFSILAHLRGSKGGKGKGGLIDDQCNQKLKKNGYGFFQQLKIMSPPKASIYGLEKSPEK
jgi:hypothetical protein